MYQAWFIQQDHSQYDFISIYENFMTDALTLRDLSKTYKNGFQALKGIDLTVPEGNFMHYWGQMAQVNRQRSASSAH